MARKAQAAMEFLTNYGWVILAAIAVFLVLNQLYSFNVTGLVVCDVGPSFNCIESKILDDGVKLYIENALPIQLNEVTVSIVNPSQGSCEISVPPEEIAPQGKKEFFVPCSGIVDEGQFTGDIKIQYKTSGNIAQLNSGRLLGRTSGKDKTPPLITISSPLDSIAYSSTVPLDYVVSDKGSLTCWYTMSDIIEKDVALSNCEDSSLGPLKDGSHYFTLYARDNNENNASKSIIFTTNGFVSCPDNDKDLETSISCGGSDCDDNNVTIRPGLNEICDSVDNNCDGVIDENCSICLDFDLDNYYNQTCGGLDCDDNNYNVNPGKSEPASGKDAPNCQDGLDNDCDGLTDLQEIGCGSVPPVCDWDGDGYLRMDAGCGGNDCDDTNFDVNPGEYENFDLGNCHDYIDNDCDTFQDFEDTGCGGPG